MTYRITILFKNGYLFTDFTDCETIEEKEALATTVCVFETSLKEGVNDYIHICDSIIRCSEIVFITLEEWGI